MQSLTLVLRWLCHPSATPLLPRPCAIVMHNGTPCMARRPKQRAQRERPQSIAGVDAGAGVRWPLSLSLSLSHTHTHHPAILVSGPLNHYTILSMGCFVLQYSDTPRPNTRGQRKWAKNNVEQGLPHRVRFRGLEDGSNTSLNRQPAL